jgi:hypothetical protein
MVTVPEIVEKIVKKSPFLDEALALGILNNSALARLIKPEVEREAMKEIQEGAVVVALNRLSQKIRKRAGSQRKIFRSAPDLIVRSNLIEMTYANSKSLVLKQKKLLEEMSGRHNYFLTFTQGINETTIIASKELKKKVLATFREEKLASQIENLSSVTVLLPQGTSLIPGVYSYILKALAWEGINVVEVVSTLNEFTIILEDQSIDSSFSIIKRLF